MKGFRAFVLRGNVVDLAVAVVVGAAFGAVVTAFVNDLLTPLISIPGSVNFAQYAASVGGAQFRYGAFINAVVSFLLIAAAVYFGVVLPVNTLMSRRKTEPDVAALTKPCPECLSAIPARATRCAFCTVEQPA